jgi:hypothetical protein
MADDQGRTATALNVEPPGASTRVTIGGVPSTVLALSMMFRPLPEG